jgi:hypothetical protein
MAAVNAALRPATAADPIGHRRSCPATTGNMTHPAPLEPRASLTRFLWHRASGRCHHLESSSSHAHAAIEAATAETKLETIEGKKSVALSLSSTRHPLWTL